MPATPIHRLGSPRLIASILAITAALVGTGVSGENRVTNATAGEIRVSPASCRLVGRRATQQMIATDRAADGSVIDATRSVEWVVRDPRIASVSSKGRVTPLRDGKTAVVARLGSREI